MTLPNKNILVIKLGALGDFIQALGPMAAIRRHHPDAHITLLTTKPYEAFALSCGACDRVWIDMKPRWHDVRGWMDLRLRLNAGDFTRVYDLQNNDRTAMYMRLLNPRPEWVGAARGASHRNTSPQRTAGLAFPGHVQTLALAGIHDVKMDNLSWLEGDVRRFHLPDRYALLVPGSAPGRPEKRWPAESFGVLAQAIDRMGYQPVIIGGAAEAETAQVIV
ncbi:MAG TPA: glycosyltransferase family 9 protein, partial [Alphaproteobacteria bacterium]